MKTFPKIMDLTKKQQQLLSTTPDVDYYQDAGSMKTKHWSFVSVGMADVVYASQTMKYELEYIECYGYRAYNYRDSEYPRQISLATFFKRLRELL